MSKRRKLTDREINVLRWANRDGYKTYRYGSTKPVSLPRVFTGEARKSKVSSAMDVLRDWRQSPFEHEGSARAGIRAALILHGVKGQAVGWHQADFEAECLVGEALKLMGAKRPSEAEGQPGYTIAREDCAWCRGPLDKEDIANNRRFCSDECSTIAKNANQIWFKSVQNRAMAGSFYSVCKEKTPTRPCGWCGTPFTPATPDVYQARQGRIVETCSEDCRLKLHQSRTPHQRCEECGDPFQTKRRHKQRYCSERCNRRAAQKRLRERNGERPCAYCGTPFSPTRPAALCCSKSCVMLYRAKQASAFTCDEPPFREAAE